jgi:hypothetical protein
MMNDTELREHLAAEHPGIGLRTGPTGMYPDGHPAMHLRVSHDGAHRDRPEHQTHAHADGEHDPAIMANRQVPAVRQLARCAQCGMQGPPQLFEPFNAGPSVACKALVLCELRQQGTDPAALLGRLARDFAQHADGKSGELDQLSTRQLAELDLDLRGPRGEFMGGLTGSVRVYLGSRSDSAQAIADTEADRLARKRRRAALKGAETRRAALKGAETRRAKARA